MAALTNYKARSWSTYQITWEEGEMLPTRSAMGEFVEILADSPIAVKLAEADDYDASTMFFVDFEQAAAGHTEHGTGPLMRLTEELWGHPPEALVFLSYEGLDEIPALYTLFVENVEGD
jgi:ABC-type nitrate/sulfonate/bicarbonate transport system substrate-binding protein